MSEPKESSEQPKEQQQSEQTPSEKSENVKSAPSENQSAVASKKESQPESTEEVEEGEAYETEAVEEEEPQEDSKRIRSDTEAQETPSKNFDQEASGASSVASGEQSLTQTPQPVVKTSRSRVSRRSRKRGPITDLTNCRIGFIGAGKMTEAIVKGIIGIAKIEPKRIFVSSKTGKNHDLFKQMGVFTTRRNYDIFGRLDCDIIFLALHGHVIKQLYKTGGTRPMALTTNYIPNQRHPIYILSLIGGVTLSEIKNTLLNPDNPDKYKLEIHRIMLNHSVAFGLGIGAIDVEPDSKKCSPIIRDLLTSISKLEYIPEANMDVACAVGGNGLPFCYYFLAAIADGAFKMGLPKMLAIKIAARTLQSASASVLESGKHPTDLRDSCTPPSGPAIYGIHVLDKADCASGIAAAVEAAYRRIKELCDVQQ